MNTKNLIIRKAGVEDIPVIQRLIRCLASYEKRPQDVTGTEEQLKYWLFERKAATVLLAEYGGETLGYALYYPVFGSFSAMGKIHLEDLFIRPEFRGVGFGRRFLLRQLKWRLPRGTWKWNGAVLTGMSHPLNFTKNQAPYRKTGGCISDIQHILKKTVDNIFRGHYIVHRK